jgi:hypothetical protein
MLKGFTQFSLAVLLAGGVPLLAQTPSQPPGQPSGQPPQTPPATQRPTTEKPTSTMAGAETTLTGCVRTQRADTGAADTKGNIYTLEVSPGTGRGEGAASGGTATSGAATSGAAKGATAKMTYTISAPDSVGIGKHVGHQVELTGRVQPAMGSGGTGAGAGAGTGAAASTKPEPGGAMRTFQATALKMISAKCP